MAKAGSAARPGEAEVCMVSAASGKGWKKQKKKSEEGVILAAGSVWVCSRVGGVWELPSGTANAALFQSLSLFLEVLSAMS